MKFKKSTISAIVILVALVTIVGLSGLDSVFNASIRNANQETEQNLPDENTMEKIYLTTADNIKIAANFYSVQNPSGWIVFSHMMPASKESWDDLAKELQSLGYESVAIDLRGHGESDGGPGGYNKFSDSDHQKSILDLETAAEYLLSQRGAIPERIYFIGASIGANLSLEYLSKHPELRAAVLLSPGLNYKGIKTESLVRSLKNGQRIFFVSSKDDNGNSEENQKLYDSVPAGAEKQIKIFDIGGHGTDMLFKRSELKELIIKFLQK